MVHAEPASLQVEDAGGVHRGDHRQEAAARVGEAGDDARAVGDRGRADRGGDPGGADREEHVSWLERHAEGCTHVVAGAARDDRAAGGLAGSRAGRHDPGEGGRPPERALEEVGSPLVLAGREVAGAGGVAAVGEGLGARRGEVVRDVVVRQQHAAHARGVVGLVVAQPPQLARGERGDQDAADGVGAGLRPAHLVDQVARGPGRSGVVPQQRVAHRRTGVVESDHPVLLACHGDRVGTLQHALGRGVDGAQPGARVDLGAVRVGRGARLQDAPVVGVDEQCLGRLGRGVDAEDESHVTIKYESRTNVKEVAGRDLPPPLGRSAPEVAAPCVRKGGGCDLPPPFGAPRPHRAPPRPHAPGLQPPSPHTARRVTREDCLSP